MSLRTSAGTDAYRAGEKYMICTDYAMPDAPACIFSTGYLGGPHRVMASDIFDHPAAYTLTKTHSVLSVDAGGTSSFANDTAIAAVGQAAAWNAAQGRPGPFLLAGVSMGFMDLMAWARTNQSQVVGAIGFFPGVDLTAAWTADRQGVKAPIDAAYGGAYVPATHAPTHSPVAYAASLNFPILVFSAADDVMVLPSEVQAFDAAAPNCTFVNLGNSGGHAQPSTIAACARPELAAFIDSLY